MGSGNASFKKRLKWRLIFTSQIIGCKGHIYWGQCHRKWYDWIKICRVDPLFFKLKTVCRAKVSQTLSPYELTVCSFSCSRTCGPLKQPTLFRKDKPERLNEYRSGNRMMTIPVDIIASWLLANILYAQIQMLERWNYWRYSLFSWRRGSKPMPFLRHLIQLTSRNLQVNML